MRLQIFLLILSSTEGHPCKLKKKIRMQGSKIQIITIFARM